MELSHQAVQRGRAAGVVGINRPSNRALHPFPLAAPIDPLSPSRLAPPELIPLPPGLPHLQPSSFPSGCPPHPQHPSPPLPPGRPHLRSVESLGSHSALSVGDNQVQDVNACMDDSQ